MDNPFWRWPKRIWAALGHASVAAWLWSVSGGLLVALLSHIVASVFGLEGIRLALLVPMLGFAGAATIATFLPARLSNPPAVERKRLTVLGQEVLEPIVISPPEPTEDIDDLHTLLVSWAEPAVLAARSIVFDQVRTAIGAIDAPWSVDVAAACQRAVDDVDRARSLVVQSVVERDGTDPQMAFAELYRHYTGLVYWLARGFVYGVLDPVAHDYRRWRTQDAKFLDQLRHVSGSARRRVLKKHVERVGYGEGVRDQMA